MENNTNNNSKPLSMWSMIFGISSWVLMWLPWIAILSFITPIVAIVLAIIAKGKEGKNGMRTAGLVLGILSIVGFFLLVILIAILGAAIFGSILDFGF